MKTANWSKKINNEEFDLLMITSNKSSYSLSLYLKEFSAKILEFPYSYASTNAICKVKFSANNQLQRFSSFSITFDFSAQNVWIQLSRWSWINIHINKKQL